MTDEPHTIPQLDSDPKMHSAPPRCDGLILTPAGKTSLTSAQVEFNRLMKRLEKTRDKHTREQSRLERLLATAIHELMPMIEDLHRSMYQLVIQAKQAMETSKLSAKRQHALADLISGKASDLLGDTVGLSEDNINQIEGIIQELGPSQQQQQLAEFEADDFDFFCQMVENAAKQSGVDLDLSDLDMTGDPAELERILKERMSGGFSGGLESGFNPQPTRPRKPTKAQLEKERVRQAQEETKTRDLKSLYKQLAKALHPDLETDPQLKQHKEIWMKRLTSAYKNGDLRDLLQIEMEWLGEESSHLSTAGDTKLQVYCSLLKEQIANLNHQTWELKFSPQFSTLRRFINPYTETMETPVRIKLELHDEILRHQGMLQILEQGGTHRKKMIESWADAHARNSRRPATPF